MSAEWSLTDLRVALRFRDIEVPDTVRSHLEVISQHKSVWWGWWHKPGELIPRRAMEAIRDQLQMAPETEIFLVDSGDEHVYRASLSEVLVSSTEEGITPDLEGVPGYYYEMGRDPARKVWFKLVSIDPIEPDELRDFAYVEFPWDEFTDDPTSPLFDGKRVDGVHELLQRVRTMWFLRPGAAGDPSERIEVETALEAAAPDLEEEGAQIIVVPAINLSPFVLEAISTPRSHYFIHLSDLHFGEQHGYPYVSNAPSKTNLALRLIDDLRRIYHDVPPIAVILSGDLTWSGSEEEFDHAAHFIDELSSAFKLGKGNFIVIPGNHDIQWAKQTATTYDPSKPVERASAEAEQNFREFVRKTLGFSANSDLSMGRRFTTSRYAFFDVMGVNSSQLEQRRFAGHGLVTEERFRVAASAMGWLDEPRGPKYRFIAMHHHLLPVVPREEIKYDQNFSIALDASEILVTALRCEADVVLHGHMHQPVASTYSRNAPAIDFPGDRTICVHAAGSAGLKRDLLGPIGRNSYTIYDLWPHCVKVRIRATSEATGLGFDDYAVFTLGLNETGGLRWLAKAPNGIESTTS